MLADELLLLALNDEKGTVYMAAQTGLDLGLAGAMIAELAAQERLQVDGEALSISNPAAGGNGLLNDAAAAIAAKPGKTARYWVNHLSSAVGGLRKRLLDSLVAQGTLERRDQRILLLFHHEVFPEHDARVEHDIRARLDAVLLDGAKPDARTRWLIQLAAACRVIDAIYPHGQRAVARKRIKALEKDEVVSDAVHAAIQAQQAAVMAAIIAASVAATSAATASACSAASSAC